jgi:ABC-2 type transport system ATP-binding protein
VPTIRCRALSHTYAGGVRALNALDLDLPAGITGIVGLNGAGKSTLLRILLGALRPTAGSVEIDGLAPEAYRVRNRVGYIAEALRFDGWLRTCEFLAGLAVLCGDRDYEAFGTAAIATSRLDQLSQGQRRRVEIAAALIGGARLLLFDEPTNGLDPIALRGLRDVLCSLRRPGMTVLVSSHHLDELERVVDRVVLMKRGTIAGMYARDELLAAYGSFDRFAATLADDAGA